MRGVRYASVMVVGLLVAPIALHAQNVQGNQNQMCSMLAGAFKNMKIGNGKIVMAPSPAPAGKASGADSVAKPSSSPTSGSSAPADSAKSASASAKPASTNSITCNFTMGGGTTGGSDSAAAKKTGAADSASHGNVADTTKAAGANKP